MSYTDRQIKYIRQIDTILKSSEKIQKQEKKVLKAALKLLSKNPPAPINEVFGQLIERLTWIDLHADDLFKPLSSLSKELYENMRRDYGSGSTFNFAPGIVSPFQQLRTAVVDGLVYVGNEVEQTDLKKLYDEDCIKREKEGEAFITFEEWNKNALAYLRLKKRI